MGTCIPEPLGEKLWHLSRWSPQLQEGKNTIHIVATDAAGNTSNLNVDLNVK